MSNKSFGLGRGLGALLSSKLPTRSSVASDGSGLHDDNAPLSQQASSLVSEVPIGSIRPNPQQPRKSFSQEALAQMELSIKEHGILQPIVISEDEDHLGSYILIAGERRWRSAQAAGLKTVPVIIRRADELERLELALIENIQREDLNAIERAQAYQSMVEAFGLTQQEAAKRLGINRSSLANSIRLLDLPAEIQVAISSGKLSEGHAKVLLALEDASTQQEYYQKIVAHQLTVRDTESMVKNAPTSTQRKTRARVGFSKEEEELRALLSTKVEIIRKGQGGQVRIDFFSQEELDTFMRRLEQGSL